MTVPVTAPEAVRISPQELGGGRRGAGKSKCPGPRSRGVDAVLLGDEKKPRKRTSKGREVGESALSTKPLSDCDSTTILH